ncbi:DNA polymerase III subunit epsilon [Pelobium manganitolerans]|uniref:DNA polymerase III subunit epsilon n=1 Tax=Pelobium manganitolerans TaxID=1842495 RepID=A0A419S3H0_9SPHI|nr:3'-5' exonuclease [Pelobium manganitolerans]RKD13842.1 DNA polymerase III subunit epsilon [Pelobium manganitolerans]
MKLNLKRPLAFFDIESTGVNVASDRIIEISILKASPAGTEEVKTIRVHPGIPIPLESSLIHGIYDEHIKDAPYFKQVAQEIIDFIGEADLAGYNSNKFDIPILIEEFLRAGIEFDIENRKFVDVQNIFHQMEQRTLKAAYKFYCDKEIVNAHSAEADIRATYEVLLAQIERYADKEFEDKKGNISKPVVNDVDALHEFTNLNKPVDFAGRMIFNEDGIACFNFGKHKGKSVFQVFDEEPSYYAWMMNGDFPLYTKNRLDKYWKEHRSQKTDQRQAQKPRDAAKPFQQRPQQQNFQKKEKPSAPADADMLQQLANKFKKI